MSDQILSDSNKPELRRTIDWRGAFWVASGVPALVLFSVGGLAGNVGKLAFAIWAGSMLMGLLQSFTYAEIAGLYPNKSGGASVYGAAAWVRYSKLIAPLSVWCNWIAWSPVLSLGCSIAAAYILNAIAPIPLEGSPDVARWLADHAASLSGSPAADISQAIEALTPRLRNWTLFSLHAGPVTFSLNAAFFLGTALMLGVFAVQHRGIAGTANLQKYMGLCVIIPMAIVGIVPIVSGHVHWDNFYPLVPLASVGSPEPGSWNLTGWTMVLGGMFIAAWSTYGFETAICYTSEFKTPATDVFKAILTSGLLCLGLFILVPFSFQGGLGLEAMLSPSIVDGSGVAEALAGLVGAGPLLTSFLTMLMILALMLSINTAMAGSSRTLYQASVDGWLPRYLSFVNHHGAPTRAMWTDLIFNLVTLSLACADSTSFFFILAVSNCGYIIFNFLNLNAGWIHRIDQAHLARPYRAPTWLLATGTLFSFVNAMFMGAGAKLWNPWALTAGVTVAAMILPVFCYRHYIQDGGKFPHALDQDMEFGKLEKRAGFLPYLALIGGVVVVVLSNYFFVL
jgi:amino acid transporter